MFESLGGPKMGDAARFHNPAELKKWKERSDKSYDRYGKRRDFYEGRGQDEYGRYLKDTGEARRLYGRSEAQAGAAQAGITSAAMRERRAGELADDRQHYAGLRERSMERQKQREAYRLDLEAQKYQPGSFDAVQAMVMDAAKMGNEAALQQTKAVASGLAKTNPVAAAKLMMDAQNTAGTNMAKAKQKGWFAGQENRMREMQLDANRIMQQSGMLGDEEQADQIMAQAHQSRIADQMNLATAGLNRSQANLALASQYGATGDRFANLAGRSLQASMGYDQMGDAMSDRRTSIEEQRMGREQELMLSDRMAQQQVDEYNAGRMGRGIQTGLAIAGTAANLYTGIQAGRAASAEADMYGRMARPAGGTPPPPDGNLISNISHIRNPDMNTRFASASKPDLSNVSASGPDPYQTMYTSSGAHPGLGKNYSGINYQDSQPSYIPRGGSGLPGSYDRVPSSVQHNSAFMNRKDNKNWRIKGSGGLQWGHGRSIR